MKGNLLAIGLAFGASHATAMPSSYPTNSNLATSPPVYPSPWQNPEADGWEAAIAQARQFVSQMTLLEKVNITTGVGWENGPCVGNTGAAPRLGYKGYCNQDSPQGIRFADYASAFTSSNLAGATWDRNLLYQRGVAMAQEHQGKGVTSQLGPVAGPLGRAVAGGRIWEGFAADPVLSGVAMAETIKGMQDTGIVATAKHLVGNEQEHFRQVGEALMYGFDIDAPLSSNIDDRTMHELYIWPFADAVRAGVGAVMCAYTQVNNSLSCQNSKTINGILKGELGFQGPVMSDWQAHDSGVSAALAGLDMSMPGDTLFDTGYSYWGPNLTIAVLNGTVPEWRLDDMATRIMAAFFKVGNTIENQRDPNFSSWTQDTYGYKYTYSSEGYEVVNQHIDVRGQHGDLIRETAAKGTVLMKNTGSLPLKKPKFLAVFGEDAAPPLGGANGCSDRMCDNGTLAMGWGSGTSNFPYLITPDAALQAQAVADGTVYQSILDNWDSAGIASLAATDDATCVVFGNADSGEGYINVDGNEGDRTNLTLWQNAETVIQNVSALCPNTIVVLHTGGPVLMDYFDNPNITAIVWAGLPGQESGNSITDVLYGKVNPAGRSPFTWAKKREDYGVDILYTPNNGNGAPQLDYTEGVYIDYRHFDKAGIEPQVEFGFGLSYTTFEYSNIKVTKQNVAPYQPTTGKTIQAPTFGAKPSTNLNDYAFPSGWKYVPAFIYPYFNYTTSLKAASQDPQYGRTDFIPAHGLDGSPQNRAPASDATAPGGNKQLYDVLYEVSVTITNTGKLAGDEVPQLYVELGGDNPPRQLRDFDRITLNAGQSTTWTGQIARRDLSNWDTVSQDWLVNNEVKTVYVGPSSRNLPLSAVLH
ncbi:glycoside hydrolase family 3 protein [Xylariaceae sp. FL0255]|nr:glycoside hydrolase family 3 protein [Xylariaceae sp. FL0255]